MSRRGGWKFTRAAQIERAKSACEHCIIPAKNLARFDVVSNGRGFLVLCRSCRVRHQSPAIQTKAAATRLARTLQLRLFTKGKPR